MDLQEWSMEMRTVVDKEKCCGCLACADICPKKAISIVSDKGFKYPAVDEALCIDCKKCEKVCPVISKAENKDYDDFETVVWAAWNASEEKRKDSTSGGMFVEIAEKFIENKGYVCGCEFRGDFKSCRHVLISKDEDIRRVTHSKYFQSDLDGVYADILGILKAGNKVLFCGTPCQAAALYNFVGEKWRKDLTIVDLFCKGVPSQVVHEKYLNLLEQKAHSKIVYYRSKSKAKDWGKFFTEVKYENGAIKRIRSPLDNLFVTQALDVRPGCALCRYKGLDRVSDLTIGDYWGIAGIDKATVSKGVSALVVNTAKGQELVGLLGDSIEKEQRSIFDVSNFKNPGFSQQIKLGKKYDAFYNDLENQPIEKVIKKYAMNNSLPAIAWRKFKWGLSKFKGISWPKFIYINFLCSHVQRGRGAYIIPGPHTIFDFQKGSKLVVEHGKALINFRKPRGSKAEAWIQLNENAAMIIHEGLDMRNCRFVVQPNAVLEIGDLEMNGLCNIVVRKKVTIGRGVMAARDVNIYDSDYHPFSLYDDVQAVATKPVIIQDHVWIGNGASIMKGVTLGEGSVVSAGSVVIKSVKPRSMVSGNPAKEAAKDIFWSKGH